MQIDAKSAQASLADIDAVIARLKQSSLYRGASTLIIMWGVLVACGYLANALLPRSGRAIWIAVDVVGLLATVAMGLQYRRAGAKFDWRVVIAVVMFFAFGLICIDMGRLGVREQGAFWPILFMFGYALAGLWLGRAFTLLGVAVAAATFAGYLWVGSGFTLYLAVVDGGGLILAGLWMRRA
jgi:hypothetical protein